MACRSRKGTSIPTTAAVWSTRFAWGGSRSMRAATTAIREGDIDGNDATVGDPSWNSLQNTPAISDYPSTMSLNSGAAAAALASVLGTDQVPFRVTSEAPFPDIIRVFTSFSQAAREAADSQVYAGIHFPIGCEDGLILGRKIGERSVALYLQPAQK